ncbi:MAG: hypothetical protein SCL24.07 [uncultured Thermomicrobiales bacterium]|uniref:Pyridoxamine 5'-phosphate oxidase N-terminal domain-containing protein n=1 Tax=uncultured Thermomicrobiales bacterium TaxID=1645740 RepID=A0A6J4UEJ7_9BACT|nr:MAG: hypothetical protein SCL24.07 [uncultured Thermomicrobiales bacterium]
MGQIYDALDARLQGWIAAQPMFFVATAPSGSDGHINLSPKGDMATFRVLDPTTVAYVDLTASGIETVAHLRDNGRIVVMFCAFAGPPRILRLHGRGRFVAPGNPGFGDLLAGFAPSPGIVATLRGIVVVAVTRIADSCGFVVPTMELVGDRDQLYRNAEQKRIKQGAGWQADYQRAKNATSIDGLPGLDIAPDASAGHQGAS